MLPRTEVTNSNRWRRSYPPPADLTSIGKEVVEWLGGGDPKQRKLNRLERRAKQHEVFMRTGFAGGNAELGHRVVYMMRCRGYSETVALIAGHLAAIAGSYNFQGNYRIAQLSCRSVRTVQRVRALLELEGLIKSCMLETGQLVQGMKAPTLHPQVLRDVSVLQRMAMLHSTKTPHRRTKKNNNAGARAAVSVVAPELQEQGISAESLDEIARIAPDFLQGVIGAAVTGRTQLEAQPKPAPTQEPKPALPPRRSWTAEELDAALELLPREVREPDKPPLH